MKRYIEQLVEDIAKQSSNQKKSTKVAEVIPSIDEMEIHFAMVERYLEADPTPISEITGFQAYLLPPAGRLTKAQKGKLAKSLERLANSFNFHLDFPQKYPGHLKYKFIRKFWYGEHVYLRVGENHIEFCSYDKSSCPFPAYCTICDEVEGKFAEKGVPKDNVQDDIEMPF